MKLDKTDLKILKKLQQDGRMTNLQLSVEIGLSPAPTLERVKKLESSGVIKSYHAQVNEHVVGLGIQALVSISLTRQIENAIAGFTEKINNIFYSKRLSNSKCTNQIVNMGKYIVAYNKIKITILFNQKI